MSQCRAHYESREYKFPLLNLEASLNLQRNTFSNPNCKLSINCEVLMSAILQPDKISFQERKNIYFVFYDIMVVEIRDQHYDTKLIKAKDGEIFIGVFSYLKNKIT